MAQSLLLFRRASLSHYFRLLISSNSVKCLSASAQPSETEDPPKPSTLSSRMSFVFDQIDRIEKQKRQQSLQSDETLHRIRSWRQSRKEAEAAQKVEGGTRNSEQIPVDSSEVRNDDALRRIRAWRQSNQSSETRDPVAETPESGLDTGNSTDLIADMSKSGSVELKSKVAKEVELVHPWPEWIELMERFVQQNYFDHKRRDEDRMLQNLGFDNSNVDQQVSDDPGIDFKDFKTVQTACLNFGKDRFDILRPLSRQDIQVLVGYGCPSADKKVVFSAKLLRKRVHLDEGDVCSSCSLRSSCERAYLLTNKEDEARTIDLMRVLLTYGFHHVNGCVVNEPLLKQKSVKTVVRKLLHEVVKLSAVPIDPNLPPPVIKKAPPKVKQPPPPPKKRVGRDDVEMKKGDWLCPKCDFMNFAKNTVCLQCDAKRPKRQLLPGEWECPECNFLNYRRNMACFHCDCKRPPDAFTENKIQEVQHDYRPRPGKVANRGEVSNAWNFNFDDDESDGADVAAFEYADSAVRSKESPLDGQGPQGHRIQDREYSDPESNSLRMGFNDFDDEDDVDSYEIDTQPDYPVQGASHGERSEVERFSGSEDDDSVSGSRSHQRILSSSCKEAPKSRYRKTGLSDSDFSGLEEDRSAYLRGKSSSVSDRRQKSTRTRRSSKGLSFVSDEDLELDSDLDDEFDANFGSRNGRGNRGGNSRGDFKRERNFDGERGSLSGSEFDSDEEFSSKRRTSRSERGATNFGRNSKSRSNNNMMGGTRNRRKDDFSRASPKSYDDDWEPRRNNKGQFREKGSGIRNFEDRKKGGGFRERRHGKSGYEDMDRNPQVFPNSRRVIER